MAWPDFASYGFYVWGAYGICALALAAELFGLRLARRQTELALSDEVLLTALKQKERVGQERATEERATQERPTQGSALQ